MARRRGTAPHQRRRRPGQRQQHEAFEGAIEKDKERARGEIIRSQYLLQRGPHDQRPSFFACSMSAASRFRSAFESCSLSNSISEATACATDPLKNVFNKFLSAERWAR